MKTKKLILLALGLAVALGVAACAPADNNLTGDRNRTLTNQTRLGNNGMMNDQGMTDDGFNNWDTWGNDNIGQNGNMRNNNLGATGGNTGLNNGMVRNNTLTNNLGNLNQNANTLARRISSLPEVNSASVVLTDDTALVGVRLRGTNQDTLSTALRQRIENMVRDENNTSNITNVSITSDPELFTRIQTMSRGTNTNNTTGINGTNGPLRNFADEVQDIIRRITPNTNRTIR